MRAQPRQVAHAGLPNVQEADPKESQTERLHPDPSDLAFTGA